MTSRSVTIVNQLGLHARAAARFVHVASGFAANVRVGRDGREMDGKSIMGLLLLSASRGTAVTISADGADEREALDALCALVVRGFDEVAVDGVHGGPFGVQGGPVGGAQGPLRGKP